MSKHAHRIAAIAQLTGRIKGKSDHVQKIVAITNQMRASAEALGNMYDTPSRMMTEAAHFAKVQSGAARLEKQRADALASISAAMGEGVREIQQKIDAKVNLNADDKYAREIRDTFKSLDLRGQHALLVELANANSGPELAAIIDGPRSVTRMTADIQQRFRDLIITMHAGDEAKAMSELQASLEPALAVLDVVKVFTSEMSDPVKLAAIELGERRAAEAEAAFNAAV